MDWRYIGVFLLAILLDGGFVYGQKMSVSTNLAGYAALGTLNAEIAYSVSRHWSLQVGAEYNPWTFRKGITGKQFQMRRQSYSASVKYWFWHFGSGWWTEGKIQYQEYNEGGLMRRRTEEGDRFGLGFAAGYTYMLHPNINIDFGLGFWGGYAKYVQFRCPSCGLMDRKGNKAFILPDDILIAITYVF